MEEHKDLLESICFLTHDCAACFDETDRRVHCDPLYCLRSEVTDVSEDGFCMDLYDDETVERIRNIADQHGYDVVTIDTGNETCIQFIRRYRNEQTQKRSCYYQEIRFKTAVGF